jgi:F-type H+-transporting ATPase subunit a
MNAAEHQPIHFNIPLSIYGFHLDINFLVVIMWAVVLVVFLFLFLANKFRKVRMIEEYAAEFISSEIASSLKTKNKIWFSFLLTLFFFILFNNLAGIIPGSISPNSNINVTAALAIMVFLISQIAGIYNHGLKHFKNIIPPGIPKPILILMIPIEIISQLSRPFSLALRLFANLFAGHTVLTIFVGFVILVSPFIKLLPIAGVLVLSFFELFVAFIQAFIFTYLSSLYISEAIKGDH